MENIEIRDIPEKKKSARDIKPGDKFGKLTVLEKDNKKDKKGVHWICQCECGNIVSKLGCDLTLGKIRSCGCSRYRKGKESLYFKDLTGQRFGSLTALEVDENESDKCYTGIYWICRCDCGRTTSVVTSGLTGGKIKSCGCKHKKGAENALFKDLTGKKFGHLTVLGRDAASDKKGTYFLCQCDCGNKISVRARNLVSGGTQSCGCLCHRKGKENPIFKDITGQQFGELTALEVDKDMTQKHNGTYWKCRCSCGKITSVLIANLKSGNTQSCGCCKESRGEKNIDEYLIRHGFRENTDYNRQKKFTDLKGGGNTYLSYDFEILTPVHILLEYQGEQHYRPVKIFGGEEQFKIQQEHDRLKSEYANEHNIPLYCVSYENNTYEKVSTTMDKIIADAQLKYDMQQAHKKRVAKIR